MENSNSSSRPGVQDAQPVGLTTGNAIVDAVTQMRFEGNILDHRWFLTPLLKTKAGLPNFPAIYVLGDIVYCHTAMLIRDHNSQILTEARKRFSGAKFWQVYDVWAPALGMTKRQLQDAVTFLHNAGIIKRTVGQITLALGVKTTNVPIIELNVELLHAVTYGTPSPRKHRREAPHVKTEGDARSSATQPPPKSAITNRKQTEASATNQQTEASGFDIVDKPSLLSGLISFGVAKKRAEVLASEYPEEMSRRLLFLPFIKDVKSPAALLCARPSEPYTPPRRYLEHLKATESEEQAQQAWKADQQRHQDEFKRAAEAEAENKMLDEAFKNLPATERAMIEKEAADRFSRLAAAGLARKSALDAAKRNIMRREMGLTTEDLLDD